MLAKLCEGHAVEAIIITLLLCIFLIALGKGAGKLIFPFLKKIMGASDGVTINMENERREDKGIMYRNSDGSCLSCKFDPNACMDHKSEHDRSMRNEQEISELWKQFNDLRKEAKEDRLKIYEKLETINHGISSVQVQVASLHPLKRS